MAKAQKKITSKNMPVGHVFSFGRHDPIQAPVDLSRIR
jgi:hypothetical protein